MRQIRGRRREAIAAAATLLLLVVAPTALADTATPDADAVTPGIQNTLDLGDVGPGAAVTTSLDFVLTCKGLNHVDAGATVTLSLSGGTVPTGGAATVDDALIGPVSGFPGDGEGCDVPAQTVAAKPTRVELRAPMAPGGPYPYTLTFDASTSNADTTAITNMVVVSFTLTVVDNTPPTLHLPSSLTVEGNDRDGATVTFEASAGDLEDDTPPAVDCSPASGSHFSIGTTTITCAATDTDDLASTASFEVTVVDTTAPALATGPDVDAVTADPNGIVVTFATPIADDLVDASPVVTCDPGSGSAFPVGSTTVTCTASDASGNRSNTAFSVRVHLARVVFDAPIGSANVVDANGSRSIPVKASVRVDGAEVTSGEVSLSVARCAGGSPVRTLDLAWSNGRWTGKLDTTGIASGCWRATVVAGSGDGSMAVGSFDVRVMAGDATVATPGRVPRANGRPTG
ncbi:MAG TPA: HYR domain-containing protein [Candidatus Limnocylindrales bacterium]|nr:HYR domain-containing protein [Candidatus Limnocylindrales bacterium]